MNPTERSTVLFDLDGTLIDTRRLYLECYRRAVEPRLARRPSDQELLALKPRSELRFLAAMVGEADFDACLADFHALYESLHPTLFGGVYVGVHELLRRLRGEGHALGIVTGKSRRSWEITTRVAPLGAFDVLVMDDDVDAAKPDPHGIRVALERLGTSPERTVYVGDTVSDVEAAVAAGVRPIACTWGRTAHQHEFARRALDAGAALAHKPLDVIDILNLQAAPTP